VKDGEQDVYLAVKLLLPGAVKRIYNLQNKQLVKLFSQVNTEPPSEPTCERLFYTGWIMA
jgi:hypothetical protein